MLPGDEEASLRREKEMLLTVGETPTPSPPHTSSGDKKLEMPFQLKQDLSLPFHDS